MSHEYEVESDVRVHETTSGSEPLLVVEGESVVVESSSSAEHITPSANEEVKDQKAATKDDVWIFGYGSLIWKPDIPFEERLDAYVEGFVRRFWQSSPDHRGTHERPGRVVTLLTPEEVLKLRPAYEQVQVERRVWGSVYRITGETYDHTMAKLEHREKAGYDKINVKAVTPQGREIDAVVFRATPENEHFIGPSSLEEMAQHIKSSVGPSGPNVEYFTKLADALQEMKERTGHDDVIDHHIHSLHQHVVLTDLEQ